MKSVLARFNIFTVQGLGAAINGANPNFRAVVADPQKLLKLNEMIEKQCVVAASQRSHCCSQPTQPALHIQAK